MLKTTNVNLELLTDVNMFTIVESGIRGGISQISHRHAISNNKYMSNYKPSHINNDENMYKLLYYDKKLQTKFNNVKYAIKNGIILYNNSKKRIHVNEIYLKMSNINMTDVSKYMTLNFSFLQMAIKNVEFYSMRTIF